MLSNLDGTSTVPKAMVGAGLECHRELQGNSLEMAAVFRVLWIKVVVFQKWMVFVRENPIKIRMI